MILFCILSLTYFYYNLLVLITIPSLSNFSYYKRTKNKETLKKLKNLNNNLFV